MVNKANLKEKSGGGVAIFVRNEIKAKVVAKSTLNSPGIEYMFVEITVGMKRVLIVVVYWPPKTGSLTELEDPLSQFTTRYNDIIIMGDFNCDLNTPLTSSANNFIDTVNSYNLQILELSPTHVSLGTETWIDHAIVSDTSKVLTYGQICVPGISKHDLLFLVYSVKCPKFKHKIVHYRDYKNIDVAAFNEDNASAPWQDVYKQLTLNSKVEAFNSIVTDLFDKHAPWKSRRVTRPAAPWLSSDIKKLMHDRDTAYRRLRKNKSIENERYYKKLRNSVKQKIRNAKIRYYYNIFQTNSNTKEVWNTLKNLGIAKEKSHESSVDVSLDDINDYFLNVSRPIHPIVKQNMLQYLEMNASTVDKFYFHNIDYHEVSKIVTSLKSNSKGSDGISAKQLKLVLQFALPALTHIINFSLTTGIFPEAWKLAYVRPLPKSAQCVTTCDYRPISILPTLSKVLEKVVRKQFVNHLTVSNLFNNLQSGFREGRSTQTALLKVTEDIRKALDEGYVSVLTLLDFSKAFDSVDYDILIARCKNLNFSDCTISWITSYLRNRKQAVVVDNVFSSAKSLERGVPQGSVLGPLFFLIYVNDLSDVLKECSHHMYADDLQIYISGKPSEIALLINKINNDLESLLEWSVKNGLILNPSKSHTIIIGSPQTHKKLEGFGIPDVILDSKIVPRCSHVNNLGLIIDDHLSWEPHVRNVCRKVYGTLHSLRCVDKCLPIKTKELLVKTLLFPFFDYGDVIYNNLNESYAQTLQRSQNACIRFIYNLRKYDHISGWYKINKILTLHKRRQFHCLCLLYKTVKTASPSYLANHFVRLKSPRFQESQVFCIPKSKTNYYNKSYTVVAAREWNKLPLSVKNSKSLKSFKKHLMKFLFSLE